MRRPGNRTGLSIGPSRLLRIVLMKLSWKAGARLVGCLLPALVAATACAAGPPVAPDFAPSADGASVINRHTRLAWLRCDEGMQWNGETCVGQALLLDRPEAIALAAARSKADGVSWRLPRVPELQRLANTPVGLDPRLFPAAPRGWHWSATDNIDTTAFNQYNYGNITQGRTNDNTNRLAFLHGWAVNMATGEARGDVTRRTRLPVRLVRAVD